MDNRVEVKVPPGHEFGKKVEFFNGRITNMKRVPWQSQGYTDKYGQEVSFSRCPLVEKVGEKYYHKRMLDNEGKYVIATYGKAIRFGPGQVMLSLDSIEHMELIRRLRDWKKTVSSKKTPVKNSAGEPIIPVVKSGRLIESEPDVTEEREFQETMLELSASNLMGTMLKKPMVRDMYCSLVGINIEQSEFKVVGAIKLQFDKDKKKFLAYFNEDKDGDVIIVNPSFKENFFNQAAVRLAEKKGFIVKNEGVYMFNGKSLGHAMSDIPRLHSEQLGEIISELKKAYGKKRA